MSCKDLKACLVCGGAQLHKYFGLDQPVCPANTYPKEYTWRPLQKYPLELLVCKDCWHSQLSVVVDPGELFSDYLYVSSTTSTLQDHFRSFVSSTLPMKSLDKISVLDIGANDYSLLREFQSRGVQVEGCDPSQNLSHLAGNIPALVGFWSTKTCYNVRNRPYDLITGLNVFAHNLNPLDFLHACRKVLKDDGALVLEMPLVKPMLQGYKCGQVYHEHINYFSVHSMSKLVEQAFMRIVDIQEFLDIHEGTMRFTIKIGVGAHHKKVGERILSEDLAGMFELQTYLDWGAQIKSNVEALRALLESYKGNVIAYGASAKFSTLLGLLGDSSLFKYVVDDNPLKVSRFQVDSELEIRPTSALLEEENPIILVTPDNFLVEIKKRLTDAEIQGKLIRYVPTVSMEDL